jgi:glycosyltransferase involved in cell wall biosynthesis
MRVGVYIICKNEIAFIERCFNSIRQADEIVICDTGSTDGTVELLQKLSIDHSQLTIKKIHVNPWRFDDARNAALYSLSGDLDVCISIDADEMLEPGWYDILSAHVDKDIKDNGKVSDRYHHRFKTVWDWDKAGMNVSEHWHERIHTRHGYRWQLPVHEVLVKCDGTLENVKWMSNFWMIQHPDTTKSRGSYLPLLEQSVKEDPKRWKTLSFLAGEYVSTGRHDDAINTLDKALCLEDADKAFLHYQLSTVYQHKGDIFSAISELERSTRLAPNIREYLIYLAKLYQVCEVEAYKSLVLPTLIRAESITERTYGYEYNPDAWGNSFDELKKTVEGLS